MDDLGLQEQLAPGDDVRGLRMLLRHGLLELPTEVHVPEHGDIVECLDGALPVHVKRQAEGGGVMVTMVVIKGTAFPEYVGAFLSSARPSQRREAFLCLQSSGMAPKKTQFAGRARWEADVLRFRQGQENDPSIRVWTLLKVSETSTPCRGE